MNKSIAKEEEVRRACDTRLDQLSTLMSRAPGSQSHNPGLPARYITPPSKLSPREPLGTLYGIEIVRTDLTRGRDQYDLQSGTLFGVEIVRSMIHMQVGRRLLDPPRGLVRAGVGYRDVIPLVRVSLGVLIVQILLSLNLPKPPSPAASHGRAY